MSTLQELETQFSAVSLEAGQPLASPFSSPITLEAVEALASRLASPLTCEVSEYVRYGSNNVIFHVAFEDESQWVCRVHRIEPGVSPLYYSAKLESTVATMRCVGNASSGNIPVPGILDWASKDPGPGLGAGYIFMESPDEGGRTGKDREPCAKLASGGDL
jgi:hypothetical protein